MDELLRKLKVLDEVEELRNQLIYSEQALKKLTTAGLRYRETGERVLLENELQSRGIFSIVDDWVRKVRDAQDAIIGAAVREANGVCGIRLVRTGMWDIISCRPDPTIPAGEIWEKVDHNIQTPPYFWKDE